MIAGGFAPDEAKSTGEWARDFHRKTGKNFLTLPPVEQLRSLDELEREEAEDLSDGGPDEPEH